VANRYILFKVYKPIDIRKFSVAQLNSNSETSISFNHPENGSSKEMSYPGLELRIDVEKKKIAI
jgi:hypothetical protein